MSYFYDRQKTLFRLVKMLGFLHANLGDADFLYKDTFIKNVFQIQNSFLQKEKPERKMKNRYNEKKTNYD